jgi:hypothetical protein
MAYLEQLKILVNLALIDGEVAAREKEFITNIGKAHGFPESSVATLFYEKHEVIIPSDMSDEQKFNYIFSLVQLMKIDERMYKDEIKFCSDIAARLGYDQQAMFELLLHVKGSSMSSDEIESLKKLIAQYLKKS